MNNVKLYLKGINYYLSLISYFNEAVPKTENLNEKDLYDIVIKHEFSDDSSIYDKMKIANILMAISKKYGMTSKVSFNYENFKVRFRMTDKLKEKQLKKALVRG